MDLDPAEQTVTLRPEGATTYVETQVVYELKYRALGALVDRLMFQRLVSGAADGFLDSLTMHAETSGYEGHPTSPGRGARWAQAVRPR